MLSPEDFAQLDNRYVRKDDCNERHAEAAKEITEVTVQQTKINTQLGLLIKINSVMLTTVAAAIVGALMKLIRISVHTRDFSRELAETIVSV